MEMVSRRQRKDSRRKPTAMEVLRKLYFLRPSVRHPSRVSTWDAIVLTAVSLEQAHLYDWQLQRAKRTGRIVFPTIACVVWDPHGALIGSRATTLNALRAFTCTLTPPRVKMRVQLLSAGGASKRVSWANPWERAFEEESGGGKSKRHHFHFHLCGVVVWRRRAATPTYSNVKAQGEDGNKKQKNMSANGGRASWVSPDWLTALSNRVESVGGPDESGILLANAKLKDVTDLLDGALFLPLFKWMKGVILSRRSDFVFRMTVLHQEREGQEQKIPEALVELENRILELETQLKASKGDFPSMKAKLVSAEQDNAALKRQLIMCTEELEVRSIEKDFSTHSAEIAGKQPFDSIKKVARLEAECRRLRALSRKASASWHTPPAAIQKDDPRSVTSSVFVDPLADSQSDHGDRLLAIENDLQDFHGFSGKPSSLKLNEKELSCSESWASALIAELDQFKNEKVGPKNFNITASKNLYLMDDFLEMEKLLASENGGLQNDLRQEVGDGGNEMRAQENGASCLEELEALQPQVSDLEEQVDNLTVEKVGLKTTLDEYQGRLEVKNRRLTEVEQTLLEIQQQLASARDANRRFEVDFEAICVQKETVEMELNTANARINTLKTNVQVKCQELEEMLAKRDPHYQETERLKAANANYEIKMREKVSCGLDDAECLLSTMHLMMRAEREAFSVPENESEYMPCEETIQSTMQGEREFVKDLEQFSWAETTPYVDHTPWLLHPQATIPSGQLPEIQRVANHPNKYTELITCKKGDPGIHGGAGQWIKSQTFEEDEDSDNCRATYFFTHVLISCIISLVAFTTYIWAMQHKSATPPLMPITPTCLLKLGAILPSMEDQAQNIVLIRWKWCRLDSSLLIPYYTVASGDHKEPCRLKADDIVQKFSDFTP